MILRADGARMISGIVPVSTADTALAGFPAELAPLRDDEPDAGPGVPDPTQVGAAGPRRGHGKDGVNGTSRHQRAATPSRAIIRLAKAPFATKAEVHVRLIDRGPARSIARGTVERRTLRLGVLAATKLKGSYLLKRTAKNASGRSRRRSRSANARS